MSLLAILLDLPAFLVGVFFLYWSVPLAVITRRVKAFKLTGLRNDAYGWAAGIKDSFGVNMLRMAGPDLYRDGTCVYLSNHRSWADFFLDVIATEGRAQMLSRMAVFFVFPMFMIPVRVVRGVILFKRGTIRDKEKFNIMVDASMHDSPMNGLIVYPEGHRSTRRASLPLKRGMLHYVFSRKHLVQIVMSSNKEAIISEKTLSAHFRQTVVVGYSEVIRSSDFGTFEEFVAAVQKAWDAEWARVYAADWNAPMTSFPENIDDQVYPLSIKMWQVLAVVFSVLCFLAWLLLAVLLARSLLLWVGPLPGTILAAIWWSISLYRAYKPIKLPAQAKSNSSLPVPDLTSSQPTTETNNNHHHHSN